VCTPEQVPALRLLALWGVVTEGEGESSYNSVKKLVAALQRAEPRNARLYYDVAR
jgi:hypothetical protein